PGQNCRARFPSHQAVRIMGRRGIKKSRRALAMTPPARDITTLLGLLNGPDPQPQVQEELYRRVEGELRKIAEAFMKRQRPLYSLEPTLLIDHAFQKLAGGQEINWGNRVHFYRFAARVMRQLIVDEVRRERAAIRGGGQAPLPLERAA